MAAYAALVCLMNVTEQILNHRHFSTSFDRYQIESLQEKVSFFLDFVETDSPGGSEEVKDLETQITSTAHEAEDVIESRIVDQILPRSIDLSDLKCLFDLQNVLTDMDYIKARVTKVKEELPAYSLPIAPSISTFGKTTTVGFDGYFTALLKKLTGEAMDRQTIAIVGMGGVGKTTLARNAYNRLFNKSLFDVHVWVTVSPNYDLREILLKILCDILFCLRGSSCRIQEKTVGELGEQINKLLFSRRYLIILDDIWSTAAWEEIEFHLPRSNNRSRIIVTTRLLQVANRVGSFSIIVDSLKSDESWNLLCETAFGEEECPLELVEIGKRIVEKCQGLPLSIVVIGGLLGKSSRMKEAWEYVEEHMNFTVNSLGIISLSYNHLPACLKPCFLYMGIFPEADEISVSRLIRLWVAEGFIKPNEYQSLEEIAMGYIEDLVDRNLISVCGLGSNGKIKSCKMHGILRDFCLRVVKKEKFLCVMRVLHLPEDINAERRLIIHGGNYPQVFDALESTSLARSLICQIPTVLSSESRLLRVLTEAYSDSLDNTFQQVNLRLLTFESIRAPIGWTYIYELPLSISLLWNVQTLMIETIIDKVVAPSEIWNMKQLRHLQFRRICLPDPPPSDEHGDFVLQNLQTLGTVSDFKCSIEVRGRMPNIKKLRIFYDDFSGKGETESWYGLGNLGDFMRLESLYCCFNAVPERNDLLQNLRFPHSLKRLTLQDCELQWSDLTIIGSLPSLEVLKLRHESVRGPRWNVKWGFPSLKFIEIDSCYLIYWNADSSHFPVLQQIILRGLHKLDEIPLDIGNIPTIESIFVSECSISAAVSAIRILEEQETFYNYLRVQVEFCNETELEEFREKVKIEGIETQNFQICGF